MNFKDFDIELLIILPTAVILILIVVSGIKTLANISQVKKIKQIIKTENLEIIKTTKAYSSAVGLKKGYPSYPSVFNLCTNSDEIFIYGYSHFPFIFRTYYPPFVLTSDLKQTKEKLKLNRVFIPDNIKIKSNRHLNIQFVDTNVIATTVDYQIDLEKNLTESTEKNLNEIKEKIKNRR